MEFEKTDEPIDIIYNPKTDLLNAKIPVKDINYAISIYNKSKHKIDIQKDLINHSIVFLLYVFIKTNKENKDNIIKFIEKSF